MHYIIMSEKTIPERIIALPEEKRKEIDQMFRLKMENFRISEFIDLTGDYIYTVSTMNTLNDMEKTWIEEVKSYYDTFRTMNAVALNKINKALEDKLESIESELKSESVKSEESCDQT